MIYDEKDSYHSQDSMEICVFVLKELNLSYNCCRHIRINWYFEELSLVRNSKSVTLEKNKLC